MEGISVFTACMTIDDVREYIISHAYKRVTEIKSESY